MRFTLLPIVGLILLLLILFIGAYIASGRSLTWGRIEWQPAPTLTVTGEAQTQQTNQLATFTAGVDVVNDNREQAVAEVNQKVTALIQAVKNFGIADKDIKTQNISIFRGEEPYYDNGVQKSRPGQWRVSNSITVVLRDMTKASALTDLLSASGATNVFGPNFSLDDTNPIQDSLLQQAVENARQKAAVLAGASGRKLGNVISVSEGTITQVTPFAYDKAIGAGGGGAPVEPGSSTVKRTVTVMFELE